MFPCADLIMHLYYTEPANFALAELLRMGFFHRICSNFDPAKPDRKVLEAIVHVLAYLFERRIRKQADQEEIQNIINRSPSNVILDPLPEDVRLILENTMREWLRCIGRTQSDSAKHR